MATVFGGSMALSAVAFAQPASFVSTSGSATKTESAIVSDAARANVAAATANAAGALRDEIAQTRISAVLTVQEFLIQTRSTEDMDQIVGRSQQIGGPRWIDDQTCQVKLEIAGSRVAQMLVSVAASHAGITPITAPVLSRTLESWNTRSFSATGTSVSPDKIPGIRPVIPNSPWMSITDDARSTAVQSARDDAASRVLEGLRPIEYGDSKTVGELLTREPVAQAVKQWIAARPVSQLNFSDDMNVELTVEIPSRELTRTLVDSASLNADAATVELIQREIARRIPSAKGVARAGAAAEVMPLRTVEVPAQPPAWYWQSLDAEASAEPSVNPLRTKISAEDSATRTLKSKIGGLSLTPSMTLDAAGKQDPRIADAIERALLHARVYKVEYLSSGGVRVRMSVDPRDLWSEIRGTAR
jgi:hypothetical protein